MSLHLVEDGAELELDALAADLSPSIMRYVEHLLVELDNAVAHAQAIAAELLPLLPTARSRRQTEVGLAQFELRRARIWTGYARGKDTER